MPEARPIDGNALMDAMRDEEFQTFVPLDEIDSVIDKAPTLDTVPVVRCRECKHYREHKRCSMSDVYRHCALHKGLAMVAPDSFCSYGDRRE